MNKQPVVFRCGDYFYGLFSGPGASHDRILTLLPPEGVYIGRFNSCVHCTTQTKHQTSCMESLTGQRPHGQRLLLLWPEILTTPGRGKSCRDITDTSAVLRVVRTHLTMFTLPSGMHTRPSCPLQGILAPHLANQITSQFYCYLPLGRNSTITDV